MFAAAALEKVGDTSLVPLLKTRAQREMDESARRAIVAAITALSASEGPSPSDSI